MLEDETIIKKQGQYPGKTLAVFCGVHGDEKAGVYAMKKTLKEVEIKKGTVYFVFANPQAIEKNVRFVEKNLNRCLQKNIEPLAYEEFRAIELMKILDQSDALLDLHASHNPKTTPFAITENGFDIVKNMNFEIIAQGFDALEPGSTDGYMLNNNKIGICLECGFLGQSNENSDLAYNSILQFLKYFEAIDIPVRTYNKKQRKLYVNFVQKKTGSDFKLTRHFSDFETIPANTIIAQDGQQKFITEKQKVILFANDKLTVGAEAYMLGEWVD